MNTGESHTPIPIYLLTFRLILQNKDKGWTYNVLELFQ